MKQYWWISVNGSKCEPAVKDKEGKVYTFGCPDPLPENTFVFVEELEDPPLTPKEKIKHEKEMKKLFGSNHGYRVFK